MWGQVLSFKGKQVSRSGPLSLRFRPQKHIVIESLHKADLEWRGQWAEETHSWGGEKFLAGRWAGGGLEPARPPAQHAAKRPPDRLHAYSSIAQVILGEGYPRCQTERGTKGCRQMGFDYRSSAELDGLVTRSLKHCCFTKGLTTAFCTALRNKLQLF